MHEFVRRLKLAAERGVLPPGAASNAHIYHDDDCAFYQKQDCNCDPIIKISPPPFTIDAEGKATWGGS